MARSDFSVGSLHFFGLARKSSLTDMAYTRILLTLIAGLIAIPLAAQGPPSSVRVSPVEHKAVQERRRVTGEIRSKHRARIAAQEPGWVVEVAVEAGQSVEKGDLLARVDARKLIIALARAKADVARSAVLVTERQAQLERAKADLDALTALAERDAANPKELRDSHFDWRVAQTRLAASKEERLVLTAEVALLEIRIADTEIRAEWPGRVIAKFTEVGQWLSIGADVVDLISVQSLEAWLLVPQAYYAALEGQTSGLEIRADATSAQIENLGFQTIPLIDPRGRTFQVVVQLADDAGLAPGMSVTAWIPTGAKVPGLLIPRSAILRNDVGSYVYMVKPGEAGQPGAAIPVPIVAKFSIGDAVVIDERTLPPGSQVVTEGNERLYPMAPIIALPQFDSEEPGVEQQ